VISRLAAATAAQTSQSSTAARLARTNSFKLFEAAEVPLP